MRNFKTWLLGEVFVPSEIKDIHLDLHRKINDIETNPPQGKYVRSRWQNRLYYLDTTIAILNRTLSSLDSIRELDNTEYLEELYKAVEMLKYLGEKNHAYTLKQWADDLSSNLNYTYSPDKRNEYVRIEKEANTVRKDINRYNNLLGNRLVKHYYDDESSPFHPKQQAIHLDYWFKLCEDIREITNRPVRFVSLSTMIKIIDSVLSKWNDKYSAEEGINGDSVIKRFVDKIKDLCLLYKDKLGQLINH